MVEEKVDETKTSKKHLIGGKLAEIFIRSGLAEVFFIASLCISRYLKNSDFSYPSEIVLDVAVLSALVLLIFYILRLVLGRVSLLSVHVAGLAVSYLLYAYSYAYKPLIRLLQNSITKNATPFGKAVIITLLVTIIFSLAAALLGWIVKRFAPKAELPLIKIILFVVSFIFVSQMAKVGTQMWRFREELTYKQPTLQLKQDKSKIKGKPNIYYLVFDRYANEQTLKDIYNFDNSSLMNNLSDLGFTNRKDAYSNYPFTMMSIGSTLRMGYQTDLTQKFKDKNDGYQGGFPYRKFLDNPPVAQALKANGYQYNVISSWWDFTRNLPAADNEPTNSYRLRILGKTYWLTDLQRDIVNKSILSPLLLKGITLGHTTLIKYDLDRDPATNFNDQFLAIEKLSKESAKQDAPQFTFAHILSPHDPYIFNADGTLAKYDSNRTNKGVDENIKYTNQLTYLNKRIEVLLSDIRTNDSEAVIVLQSDEGPYPKQFQRSQTANDPYDPTKLPLENMKQKFGILASYYLPGVNEEASKESIKSSVNAFRFVLRNYLGYDLPNLPDCQFSVNSKYHLYVETEVTGSLRDTTNPVECAEY